LKDDRLKFACVSKSPASAGLFFGVTERYYAFQIGTKQEIGSLPI
jgi:hypothetical protein